MTVKVIFKLQGLLYALQKFDTALAGGTVHADEHNRRADVLRFFQRAIAGFDGILQRQ